MTVKKTPDYKHFKQQILSPWWAENPLQWDQFKPLAEAGSIGLFNLCWLTARSSTPPVGGPLRLDPYVHDVMLGGKDLWLGDMKLHHAAALMTPPELYWKIDHLAFRRADRDFVSETMRHLSHVSSNNLWGLYAV